MKYHLRKAPLVLTFIMLATAIFGCTRLLPASFTIAEKAAAQAVSKASYSASDTFDSACMVGKWSVANMQQMMQESYLQSQGTLQLERIDGRVEYEFDDQGRLYINFDGFSATLNGEMEGQKMRVRQTIEGAAMVRYQIDDTTHRLMLTDFGGDGITFALAINDQRLVEIDFPAWRAFMSESKVEIGKPTLLVEYAYVQAECSGDVMTIQALEPLPGPEFKLERIK